MGGIIIRLSFSKLEAYEKCKKSFYYSAILGIKPTPNHWLVDGNEIHSILYNSTKEPDWKTYIRTQPRYNEFKELMENYIEYQDNVIKSGGSAVPEHAELKGYDKQFDFSWIADRIDKFGNKKLICDYKTGKVGNHDKQLLIYAFFYNKEHPDDKITHYAPFFVKHHKTIKAKQLNDEDIKKAIDWLINLKEEIEHSGYREKNYSVKCTPLCKWCSYTSNCKEGAEYIAARDKILEVGDDE